jgi:hypothetical protein
MYVVKPSSPIALRASKNYHVNSKRLAYFAVAMLPRLIFENVFILNRIVAKVSE